MGKDEAGNPRVYTPKKTKAAEAFFAMAASSHSPAVPFGAGVSVLAEFVFPVPSGEKNSVVLYGTPHLIKPDLDNLEKLVLDGLQKARGFWRDDCQVCRIQSAKRWQDVGEEPGIWLRLEGVPASLSE